MILTFGAILALILAGLFVEYVLEFTWEKIAEYIRKKRVINRAKKWLMIELKALVNDPNIDRVSLDQLDQIVEHEGYTHASVVLDENDDIIGRQVELIKKDDVYTQATAEIEEVIRKNGGFIEVLI